MEHSLRPACELRSRLDAYPRVLIAMLAKQKERALPLFLRCIQELDYPKSSIVLYVRTNNNTDRTEQILRHWIARVGSSYAAVELDAAPVEEPVETFAQHEWNATRFRVLGNIRNVSLAKTGEHACDFYFVCDVDNFIRPCTLRELVALKLPIVAPLLRITDPDGYYSNFFAEIDPNGFYGHCDQYQWILQRRVRGVFEVPLVHCTYLIRGDVIPKLRYLDGSDRYEFVVFSDGARKAGIQQYIDNRQVYGYITFDAESDAATGIVGDHRDDQIAFARREIERQHGQELSIQDSRMDTMPTISVMAPRRPSNDFANGFNELSETIFCGLRHLGYHARIVSRLSEADGQIIVVGANTLSHDEAMQLPAGTVIYNAEPFPQVWQVFPRYADEVLRKYKVWDYNPENAKRLSASLGKAVEYVPLGYVPELTRIEKTDLEDIDVLFYGTVNARRRTILDRLEATGLKVNILCGVFGTERNAWIARSKVVLNVHSHEPGVFEIVRVAFLLANAKAVVSECNPGDAGEAVDADLLPGIVAAKYDDLVEACVSLVTDDDRRHAIEQAGFAAFQARRESDILKNALAATESDAAKGIVREGRHDQIATAAIELEKVAEREPPRAEALYTSPISSRLGLGTPLPEVFVINLDRRTDRWAAIESTCKSADLMPVRIPAIEASPAWRGCTLSHLKCIRLAKERNLPWVLILEDDAAFTPETIDRFRGLLGYLWENREHWERFSGGPTLPTTNPAIRILSREPPLMYVPGLTTHFSLVHSDAYEMILTWVPECDPVIDMFYISLESRFRFRNIATVPHIAVQTTSRSDLTGSEMDSSGYYRFSEQKLRECLASGVVTDCCTSQIAIADEELTRATERGSSHVEVRTTQEDAVELVNLALNKPAAQSSTSQWSKSPVAAEDARGANNGKISCEMGFHTDREHEPWWQVDLEGSYLIRKVVIFNRREQAARLKHFSLFRSLDGTHWKRFFRKIDSTVFGDDADNRPYVAEAAGNQPARFLRVRLDGHDYLHFKECQVFGDPLDPTALRQCVEEDARAEHARLELPNGRSGHMADVGGFTVFVDTDRYAPNIVFCLDKVLYEGGERQLTAELIRPTDRVIEAGTAIGVVSMTAAAIVGAESVLTFDANPEIVEDARQNFRRNGFCGIKSRIGVLKNRSTISRPDEIVDFHVDAAFWTSRLDVSAAMTGIVKTVQVPVFCLEDEICAHAANVLICDIEGGEAELLTQADLSGIRLIIMETHYWSAGEGPIDLMMNKLIREGFSLHLGHSGHHMVVLRR